MNTDWIKIEPGCRMRRKYQIRSLRYFILGPVIVWMALGLPKQWEVVAQVIAGAAYTSLGFLCLVLAKDERKP